MVFIASTQEEYRTALAELSKVPIVGTHRIGALTITVSEAGYLVTHESGDKRYLVAKGRSGMGHTLRHKVNVAVKNWLRLQSFQ